MNVKVPELQKTHDLLAPIFRDEEKQYDYETAAELYEIFRKLLSNREILTTRDWENYLAHEWLLLRLAPILAESQYEMAVHKAQELYLELDGQLVRLPGLKVKCVRA